MQNTPNYNYNLPEYSDSADIAVLNANFSSIDANEYRIEGKLNALGNDIALPYDNTATYSVGDYVIYNNALYRCITAIATAEDFDSTKWTAITIGGELKSHDTRISTLDGIRQNNAGFHNSIYRGKFLGNSVTAEQYAQITAGTFDDLFIGDYWTINSVDYVIAGFDYWWNCGNTFPSGNVHHIVLVTRGTLYSAKMNDTDITTGGYVGSAMYTTNLASAKTIVTNAFGAGHIYSHNTLLTNSVTPQGEAGGNGWYPSTVELMSEVMVYGHAACGKTIYEIGSDKTILPIFTLDPAFLDIRDNWWLRSVASGTQFALVGYNGSTSLYNASASLGVRPCFAIYGGD